MAWIFEEDSDVESKVHCTLKEHYDFWVQTGASQFALSVVRNGYIPELSQDPDPDPGEYQEDNNKSYRENRAWANVRWRFS